jgi:hypothetical protein
MRLMKLVLYFQAFVATSLAMVARFVCTIIWGEEEAFRRCQQGAMEWVSENQDGMAAFLRIMQSPVKVTMPDRPYIDPKFLASMPGPLFHEPQQIDAEFIAANGIVFEAGPGYRILRENPPNDDCPFWIFDFTGPGFERNPAGGGGFAFIGATQQCGESHMGALARAFAAGHASAPVRPEGTCPTRS